MNDELIDKVAQRVVDTMISVSIPGIDNPILQNATTL